MNDSLWTQILPHLSQTVDETRYNTWFVPLKPKEATQPNTLSLCAPNKFSADFLQEHYAQKVLTLAQQFNPHIENVLFTEENKTAPEIPVTKPQVSKSDLNPQYTYDLFVVGPSNEFARSVSFAVAEAPGKTKFNPLLIYGGVGLGKTHLLHAIGNYVREVTPHLTVTYVTSEQFYFDFIDSIKNNSVKAFSDTFRQSNLLLVDDVQFLAGKESTQEEFFYIFNTLYQNGHQIVLTSDLPPAQIKGLQDRLVSRFQWGLCVDIQPPGLETRVAILKKKAEKDHLNIPDDVLYYIAENVSSNIREIEGVVIKLLAFSSITNTDVTMALVRSVLKDTLKPTKSRISIDSIIDAVADYYKVPVDNIREKNRRKEVAHCRQVAMYISKSLTKHSLKTIGLHFGGRDHSTVIHAISQIDKARKQEKTLADDINYIISQLS